MKALVVDDDQAARIVLRRALSREFAWTTVEAADGGEMLRVLSSHDVHIVFLDLHMPGMGGIEALQQLRANPQYAALPVVVTTADDRSESVQEAIALGVTDYLVKPIDADSMRARLTRALARHRKLAS